MRKTDKKLDNQIRIALTQVCETALKQIEGFEWLTHTVNYTQFPQSLKVVCVFDTNEQLTGYLTSTQKQQLAELVKQELLSLNIKIKNIDKHIAYDTEENCTEQHNGNWAFRLGL